MAENSLGGGSEKNKECQSALVKATEMGMGIATVAKVRDEGFYVV